MSQEGIEFIARQPVPMPTCDTVEVVLPGVPSAPREEAELEIDWEAGLVQEGLGTFIDVEHDVTKAPLHPSLVGLVGWKRAAHVHDKNTPMEEPPGEMEEDPSDPWRAGAPVADQFPDWLSGEATEERTLWVAEPEAEIAPRQISPLVCDDSLPIYTQWLTAMFQLIGAHGQFVERALWELISPQTKTKEGKILPIVNPSGKYVVTLFLGGKWRQVMIDDRIPCIATKHNTNSHISALPASTTRSLWPSILGKAIIKSIPLQQDFAVLTALTGWLPKMSPLTWPALCEAYESDVFLTVELDTVVADDDKSTRRKSKRKPVLVNIPWIIAEIDEFEGEESGSTPPESWKQVRLQALNWRPKGSLAEKRKEVVQDDEEEDEEDHWDDEKSEAEESREEEEEVGSHISHQAADNAELAVEVERPVTALPPIAVFHKSLGAHGYWILNEQLPAQMCTASSMEKFTVALNDQWWSKKREEFKQTQPKLLHFTLESPSPFPEELSESKEISGSPDHSASEPQSNVISPLQTGRDGASEEEPIDPSAKPEVRAQSAEIVPLDVRTLLTYAPLDNSEGRAGCYVLDVCEWFGATRQVEKTVTLMPKTNVVSTELMLGDGEYWFLVLESPTTAGSTFSCSLEKPDVKVEFLDIPETLLAYGTPVLSVSAPEEFAGVSAVAYNVWAKTLVTTTSPSVTMLGYLSDPLTQRHVRVTWLRTVRLDENSREKFPFAKPQTLATVVHQGAFVPMATLPVIPGVSEYLLLVEALLPAPMRQPDWNFHVFGSKDSTLTGSTLSSENAQRWEGDLPVRNARNKDFVLRERIMATEGDTSCTLRLDVSLDTAFIIAKLYVQHPAVKLDAADDADDAPAEGEAEEEKGPQPAGSATDLSTYGGRYRCRECIEEIDSVEGRASLTFPHVVFVEGVVYILEVTVDPYKGEPITESKWVLQAFGDRSLEVGEDVADLQLEAVARAQWGSDEEMRQHATETRKKWVDEGKQWEWEQMEVKDLAKYSDEIFTDEIKIFLARCHEAPDPTAPDVDEVEYTGEYTVQPLTDEVMQTRADEDASLAAKTAEKWASYAVSAEEQLKLNAETMEKLSAAQNEHPWFQNAHSEEREALRSFVGSRFEKQEALRVALMEADFDADAITAAAQEAKEHYVHIINAALVERAAKRVLLWEQVCAVQAEVVALVELQGNGAKIVEESAGAQASLEELVAQEALAAEEKAAAQEALAAEEKAAAQEALAAEEKAAAQEEQAAQEKDAAQEQEAAQDDEPAAEEEQAGQDVEEESEEKLAKKAEVARLEIDVADFKEKEKGLKDKIAAQHDEASALMTELSEHTVPVADTINELEQVKAAIKEPEVEGE
eukprot:GEMP01003525.1.p1 GENE.GEMP01003525.1~~GEMP01003525.1.p1  ORF type:complete len:1353 (+),score=513.44 GEMP01003525.1:111-4169(+)